MSNNNFTTLRLIEQTKEVYVPVNIQQLVENILSENHNRKSDAYFYNMTRLEAIRDYCEEALKRAKKKK